MYSIKLVQFAFKPNEELLQMDTEFIISLWNKTRWKHMTN